MCGVIGFSGDFSLQRLRDGMAAIAHRGPDDQGIFHRDASRVALGHVRLSIIDLTEAGHQPMFGCGGNVAVVFNGEIYNFLQLRKELIAHGCVFNGQSDTEVLLNLYIVEGEAFVSRLQGVFAIAIWDSRDDKLLVFRDALGVKPLYFYAGAAGFSFSSEIKGLLHLVPGQSEIDLLALRQYVTFLWSPGELTLLKGVKKVLPGEALLVRGGRVCKRWTWYQLPVFRRQSFVHDEFSAVSATEFYLKQAVQRQMVSDVPLGAFLSGGLDSSSIVAFAREINPDIHCFTIDTRGGMDDGSTDDLPYARRVAKHLGVRLEVAASDSSRLSQNLERMVFQLDEPLADPAPLNVLYISQLARDMGVKVLLSGAGGDDLFTGYRRHKALAYERYWDWLPTHIRRRMSSVAASFGQRRAFGRRIAKLFSVAEYDGDERISQYFAWDRRKDIERLLLASHSLRDQPSAVQPMLDFLAPLGSNVTPLERMLALEQRFFLADHNLIYTDKMSMAVGVEVRVPFLDTDLVEFSQRVPGALKQRGGISKWVLKRAMEPYLPKDVVYRPKTGFGAPIRSWIGDGLRPLVGDYLSFESVKRRGLFDPVAVQALISDNDSGRKDAAYSIFSLLCIEIWCRRFLDCGRL